MVSVVFVALVAPLGAQTAFQQATRESLAPDDSAPAGLLLGAPDVPLRMLFGRGDAVLLNLGSADGVSVGAQHFTRLGEAPSGLGSPTPGILVALTCGWLRVVEVVEHSALAVVEGTCAEIRRG